MRFWKSLRICSNILAELLERFNWWQTYPCNIKWCYCFELCVSQTNLRLDAPQLEPRLIRPRLPDLIFQTQASNDSNELNNWNEVKWIMFDSGNLTFRTWPKGVTPLVFKPCQRRQCHICRGSQNTEKISNNSCEAMNINPRFTAFSWQERPPECASNVKGTLWANQQKSISFHPTVLDDMKNILCFLLNCLLSVVATHAPEVDLLFWSGERFRQRSAIALPSTPALQLLWICRSNLQLVRPGKVLKPEPQGYHSKQDGVCVTHLPALGRCSSVRQHRACTIEKTSRWLVFVAAFTGLAQARKKLWNLEVAWTTKAIQWQNNNSRWTPAHGRQWFDWSWIVNTGCVSRWFPFIFPLLQASKVAGSSSAHISSCLCVAIPWKSAARWHCSKNPGIAKDRTLQRNMFQNCRVVDHCTSVSPTAQHSDAWRCALNIDQKYSAERLFESLFI